MAVGKLPSLQDVMDRKSQAPVDLFNFYIYMRDTARFADYLDLYLDITQHYSLCRLYVRQAHKALKDYEKEHSSVVLDSSWRKQVQESPQLGMDQPEWQLYLDFKDAYVNIFKVYYRHPDGRADEIRSNFTSPNPDTKEAFGSPNIGALRDKLAAETALDHMTSIGNAPDVGGGVWARCSPDTNSSSMSCTSKVNEGDIRASAERILYTYLVANAEREVTLPEPLLSAVSSMIEIEHRDDPDVFEDLREYIFQAMEHNAYPNFLRYKTLGNIGSVSSIVRLVLGLFFLFCAFWISFTLIFLDYKPKVTRLFALLPFALSMYSLISYEFNVCPILSLLNVSESTWNKYMKVKEPIVKSTLHKRALWVSVFVIISTSILTATFASVPGHRL